MELVQKENNYLLKLIQIVLVLKLQVVSALETIVSDMIENDWLITNFYGDSFSNNIIGYEY